MAMSALQLRRAGVGDLTAIHHHVQAGFDSYADFAPPGWAPPQVAAEAPTTQALLRDADTWALLALHAGDPVGHAAFFPGRERAPSHRPSDWRARPLIPGLAHLWQLFVLAPWWGQGVAPTLHEAAITEMRRRAFTRARLYTPTAHKRARRFYERRGWRPGADAFHHGLALELTEYWLQLTPNGSPGGD
jgi:GNAT superfamily N-acetyltransferase